MLPLSLQVRQHLAPEQSKLQNSKLGVVRTSHSQLQNFKPGCVLSLNSEAFLRYPGLRKEAQN